jgi:Fe2+ transport system protein FeoA
MDKNAGFTSLAALAARQPAIIRLIGRRADGASNVEIERRLLAIGFEEGQKAEVRHLGPFGGEPIAVSVGQLHIALRRSEAAYVLVERVSSAAPAADRANADEGMEASR